MRWDWIEGRENDFMGDDRAQIGLDRYLWGWGQGFRLRSRKLLRDVQDNNLIRPGGLNRRPERNA